MVVDEQVSFFDCCLVRVDPEQFDKQTEHKTTWHFYFWAEKKLLNCVSGGGEEARRGDQLFEADQSATESPT